ncbi:hypothetical protein ACE2AK_25550, partial [Rahnella perminowiae]|uniref:hypothetical protein n=1 Tax=Rahnella perminowiae TaxID=2816244 RepID=UPI0036599A07
MNSEINSLDYGNNIQAIPESNLFSENNYKQGTPIIYHSESDKIIDQYCERRLLDETPNKKSITHKIHVIRKCNPEHIGDIFLRSSENDENSIILDINIHTPLGEKIKTGLFRTFLGALRQCPDAQYRAGRGCGGVGCCPGERPQYRLHRKHPRRHGG